MLRSTMHRGLIVLSLVAATSAARADEKSPALAVTATVGPFVVGATAFVLAAAIDEDTTNLARLGAVVCVVGPAAGRWYTGDLGLLGLGVRALGAAASYYGSELYDDAAGKREPPRSAAVFAYGGMAVVIGATLYDAVRAGMTAHALNEVAPPAPSTQVTPLVLLGGAGLGISGSF